MRFYDLWSLQPGNLVGEYPTEADALAAARALLAAGWSADELSLGWGDTDDEEQGGEIATGADLSARALAAAPHGPQRSA